MGRCVIFPFSSSRKENVYSLRFQVSIHRDMAILSLVGKQMRNMVGIAGKMFQTLADGNVNIEMISQGASEINISCVIDSRDAVKALNIIHQSCLMIRPEGPRGRGALGFYALKLERG